jgi:two-component system, LytTR family, response regulator
MKKALIIDDEPLARSIVQEYLQAYPQLQVVQECSNGFEGLKAVQEHHPDLIFLDIQMPKINGFEMLELLDHPPAVIFTTAFDEYAVRAFETHAVDYLLKPFIKERFDKAVQKWLDQHAAPAAAAPAANTEALLETAAQSPGQQDRVVVKAGHKIHIIPVADIHYLEAASDYVNIHTAHGAFLKKRTMNQFEQALDEQQFVRVHRSYIVQVQQITRIDPYQKDTFLAVLRSGKQVPVSRTGYNKLKTVLEL